MQKNTNIFSSLTYIVSHLLLLNTHLAWSAPNPGLGPNTISLNCGSQAGGTDADGRKWESDSKYLNNDKSVMAKAEFQDPSLPSEVPYMTARIFSAEATYKFAVNGSSRYFLRLHFYPSPYPNQNTSNSFFSVAAGEVTLLSNFSAYLTAEALSLSYIIKEYTLAPLTVNELIVTFKPSDKYSGSFAFVNGIELIESIELFDEDVTMVGVGSGDDRIDTSTMSSETMVRLNVGGQYIPPTKDSGGLMRSWYDDIPYLYGGQTGLVYKSNSTVTYHSLPPATAPLDVYATYRAMGVNNKVNLNYNLTWVFQVDANYSYLVRLHFCELLYDMVNERAFTIYLNNQTAVVADVIGWTNGKNIPVRKDFMVYVNDKGDDSIWVALHPDQDARPVYYDAFLNGIEIFKLQDGNNKLAGPNPTMSDMMRKSKEESAKGEGEKSFASKKSYTTAIIGGAAGGAAAFGLAAAICLVAYNRKRRQPGSDSCSSSWLPIYGNSQTNSNTSASKSTISGKSHGGSTISSDAACNCRYFSLAEIRQATKNFHESNVIGVGGFGKVYKGVIDGDTKVAIKRSNPSSEQGVNEFQTEIEMLSKLRHRHLVSLIGFCEDNGEMILVYDYMGRGTMREHLYKGNKIVLTWKQRLEICIGAARGLHYLHTGAKYTIIHRDVKTTNILVDDKWVAKVSDFGLSKTGPNMNQGHVSTVVKGSFGYLDPEYFRRQQLTEKSDVYSFGVVLFEALCARPALNPSLSKEQVSLADYAQHCYRKGTLEDIIDPQLKGKINPECLKKFADTAVKCLSDHGIDRPSMGDVLWNLEFALQLQENPDNDGSKGSKRRSKGSADFDNLDEFAPPPIDHNSFMEMHMSTLNLNSDSDDENTDDVFSQIVNPKGR